MPFLLLGRTDDSDIDTIVWPDTCAIAERLWSPADASPDTSQAAWTPQATESSWKPRQSQP